MASDNSISILISAKDNASQQLKQVNTEVQQLGTSSKDASEKSSLLGGALESFGSRLITVGQLFAAYGIIESVQNFTTAAVSASAQLEQTNISFQSLIGNAQVASQVFGELVQYANVTPFQSKDVTAAAKQLLAFGQNAEQVVTTVKQLGDVTSAGGGDLQALALVTGQIFAQGKLRAQDMYQVINDGGAGLVKIMANQVGGMQHLTAEFETGGIPAQQYFDAITTATGNGGFAFQGAQKQAETFNGKLSTLKDAATQFGEALLGVHTDPQLGLQIAPGGLFDRMKNGIQGITDGLQAWEPTVQRVVPEFIGQVQQLSGKIADFLQPSFSDLWKTISQKLMPALDDLWHKVIEPLVTILSGAFLVGVQAVVTAFSDLLKVASPVIQFLADNKWIVDTFGGAFLLLKADMALGAAFDTIKVAIATFRLITIPSLVASISTVGDTWIVQGTKAIASFALTAAKATIQATATAAIWIAKAAAVSIAWTVTELPKLLVTMSVVAVKSAVYAADTSLAWVLNATRVSFVWVTQEMPKLLVSFAVTAARSTVFATATSAVWVARATVASTAWVITSLPRIVAGFVVTAAEAVVNATIASAAWVAAASRAAVAWVVTQLPRIIAAMAVTAASAVASAAVASAAWITSGLRSSASYEAFAALVATPLVMPAIAVGAALAAIGLVADAISKVSGALGAMNDSYNAAASAATSQVSAIQKIEDAYKAGKISKTQEVADIAAQNRAPTHALGTNFAGSDSYIAGESGPELVVGAKGSKVYSGKDTRQMLGGGKSVHIENLNVNSNVDVRRVIRELGRKLQAA